MIDEARYMLDEIEHAGEVAVDAGKPWRADLDVLNDHIHELQRVLFFSAGIEYVERAKDEE